MTACGSRLPRQLSASICRSDDPPGTSDPAGTSHSHPRQLPDRKAPNCRRSTRVPGTPRAAVRSCAAGGRSGRPCLGQSRHSQGPHRAIREPRRPAPLAGAHGADAVAEADRESPFTTMLSIARRQPSGATGFERWWLPAEGRPISVSFDWRFILRSARRNQMLKELLNYFPALGQPDPDAFLEMLQRIGVQPQNARALAIDLPAISRRPPAGWDQPAAIRPPPTGLPPARPPRRARGQ